MKTRKRKNHVPYSAEQLEVRVLPSVTSMVVDGELIIKGDDADDTVVVEQDGENVVVTANEVRDVFSGVTDDIKINTGKGEDKIYVLNMTVPDDLEIKTKGPAFVQVDGVTVKDDLEIKVGSHSTVEVINTTVEDKGKVQAKKEKGEDLSSLTLLDSSFAKFKYSGFDDPAPVTVPAVSVKLQEYLHTTVNIPVETQHGTVNLTVRLDYDSSSGEIEAKLTDVGEVLPLPT